MSKLDTIKGTLAFGCRTVLREDLLMEADKLMCNGRFDEGVQLRTLVESARQEERVEELERDLKATRQDAEEAEEELRKAREQVEEAIRRLDRLKEKLEERLDVLGDVVPAKRLDALGEQLRDSFADAMNPLYDV